MAGRDECRLNKPHPDTPAAAVPQRDKTNGGPGTATQTLSQYIYFYGMKYGQIGFSASVAWLMVIPMIFLTYLYAKFVFRKA